VSTPPTSSAQLELPLVAPSPAPDGRQAVGITRDEWLRLAHRAKVLSWVSLAYMTVEGAVAIIAGIVAGSVALIGFGIDSAIEGFASLVIVWRFTGHRLLSEHAEQRAQRLVAIQFFLLAPYITFEALKALIAGEHPDVSPVGIALSITSLAFMPYLGRAKQRIGEAMGSVATKGEGQQNLLCAYLSAALLAGLAGNAAFGLWWLDPAVGLVIGGLALKEGIAAWQGDGCCAPAALPTAEPDADTCCDECCT
jgi:divalent metal cation (Fe/Co/Zn/Cd) transporter